VYDKICHMCMRNTKRGIIVREEHGKTNKRINVREERKEAKSKTHHS